MKAHIELPGRWKVSKQNSYCAGKYGRKYKNPAYFAEQSKMLILMHPQLISQRWRCTKKQVSLRITFHGSHMPVDWDNCGLITDAMQGVSQIIGKKRMRGPGPVVWDDRQFYPVVIDWIKDSETKIVIELEEILED